MRIRSTMPARAALGRLFLLGGLPDKAMELAEPGLDAASGERAAADRARRREGAAAETCRARSRTPRPRSSSRRTMSTQSRCWPRCTGRMRAATKRSKSCARGSSSCRTASICASCSRTSSWRMSDTAEAAAQLQKVIELQPRGSVASLPAGALSYCSTKDVRAAERVDARRGGCRARQRRSEGRARGAAGRASRRRDRPKTELKEFAPRRRTTRSMRLALARFYETQQKADAAPRRSIARSSTTQELEPDGAHGPQSAGGTAGAEEQDAGGGES